MQGFDIAKDRTVVPNKYLVLRFDFSISPVNAMTNDALGTFYKAYLPYFKVNEKNPLRSWSTS